MAQDSIDQLVVEHKLAIVVGPGIMEQLVEHRQVDFVVGHLELVEV